MSARSVGELDVALSALRDLLDERDRRHEQRFQAQQEALAAASHTTRQQLEATKEAVKTAFATSEKAVEKQEAAQAAYNLRTNEFRGQLADQAKTLMPREECQARFAAYDEKIEDVKREIQSLRESRSEGGGRQVQQGESRQFLGFAIMAGITLAGVLVALATYLSRIH